MTVGLRHRGIVAVLDEDPDLGEGIDPSELDVARQRTIVGVVEAGPPEWDTRELAQRAEPGWLGLLLLDGLMMRRVAIGRRATCELFGRGDLLRPWDTDGEYDPLPIAVSWLVLRPIRMAVLDTAFVLRTARWPTINSHLVGRVAQRARYLALSQTVTHLPRAHARLLLLFWLLAERWGTVNPEGIRIVLPVTHDVLAMLIGAQRPTTTLALQRLKRADLLIREASDCWLLTRRALEMLSRPESLAIIGEPATLRDA